jgi:hypothetical protein
MQPKIYFSTNLPILPTNRKINPTNTHFSSTKASKYSHFSTGNTANHLVSIKLFPILTVKISAQEIHLFILNINSMKKYTMMALIAFFTVSLSVSAQNNNRSNAQDGNRGQRNQTEMRQSRTAAERTEIMTQALQLTTEEKAQVKALFEKQDAQRAEQRELQRTQQGQRSQDQMRATRERTLAENDAELEKIIGKDRLQQWQKHRAENSNNRTRRTR